jgi:dolichol-phosphate mannosyltransferase
MHEPGPMLSILMPVHNEADVIAANIDHTVSFLAGLPLSSELVVVDDGSSDGSWRILKGRANGIDRVRLLRHSINIGKGSAIRDAIQESRGEWLVLIDADLELPVELLSKFIDIQKATGADLVVGSKRHPESVVEYPWTRRILSRAYNLLVRSLFQLKVSDTQVGFKLLRGDLARKLGRGTLVKRFAIDVEVLVAAQLLGARVVDAPIRLRYSREGAGRVNVATILEIARETAGIWYRRYVTGYYFGALGAGGSSTPRNHQ